MGAHVPCPVRHCVGDCLAERLHRYPLVPPAPETLDGLVAVVAVEHREGSLDLAKHGGPTMGLPVEDGVCIGAESDNIDAGEVVLVGEKGRSVIEPVPQTEKTERLQRVVSERADANLILKGYTEGFKREILP